MPYIESQTTRRLDLINGEAPKTAGELNFRIFYFVKFETEGLTLEGIKSKIGYFVSSFLDQGKNYQRYNDMTGALIRCGLEIERRIPDSEQITSLLLEVLEEYNDEINIYEDRKVQENGDVNKLK